MAKRSEQLKLRVVREYLIGVAGTKVLAQRPGVGQSGLRRWIATYAEHGPDALRKSYCRNDARFSLSVHGYMWKNELSQQQAVAVFGIRSSGCIAKWERRYHDGGMNAPAPRPRARPETLP